MPNFQGSPDNLGEHASKPKGEFVGFLTERDLTVLRLIEEEDLTAFTFDGLKRRLGIHPETLSRVLNRLEGRGMLERGSSGYRVKPEIREGMAKQLSLEETSVSLLHTLLPRGLRNRRFLSQLEGKWFGVLRWLGYSENGDDVTLKWITEDGKLQVDARFWNDELDIQAKLRQGSNLSEAINASHQLLNYITKAYSRFDRGRGTAFFIVIAAHPVAA